MLNFRANADALGEGVYIGDWGFRNILRPSKNKEGQYGKLYVVINKISINGHGRYI